MSLPPRALSAQVEEDETSGTATHPPPPPRPPHTDPISPQTTSPTILRQDDTVSPQLTGVGSEISSVDALRSTQDLLSPSAQYQQYQQPDGNIHAHAPASETVEKQVAKPAYPGIEVVSPPYSERDAPASAYAPKVVEGYAPAPPQVQNGLNGRNYYAVAMPLRALQQGPGPVDCPICNVREVTRVEYMTGNYTQ
ncbi:hypothetical protein PVAG01_03474 [Phlyctema vagabunda]|uniref:LITAF domain-containing protein n=1 Tax=Phlyctema vagabunda TaxID=108571 RepID=A0ABR4PLT5_9HELO